MIEAPSPVRSRRRTLISGAATPATVNYPANVVAGDVLLMAIDVDTSQQNIVASGWTEGGQGNVSGESGAVFWRTADGTEGGGTFQVSFDITSRDVNAMVYAIPADGAPEITATATATSISPNAPALSPSGGNRQYLWFVPLITDGIARMADFPEGLGGWSMTHDGSGTLIVAERLLTAATYDPPALTLDGSKAHMIWTVAVPVTVASGNFPKVEGVVETPWQESAPGGVSNQVINLPAGIQAGDLLLVEIGTAHAVTPTIDGWTTLLGPVTTGSAETGSVWYREADGTEVDPVAVTLSGNSIGAATCRRVSNVDIAKLEGAIAARAATFLVTPLTLTPAAGSDEVLWLFGYTGDTLVSRPAGAADGDWPFNYVTAPAYVNVDSGVYSGCQALEAASVTPDPVGMQDTRRHVTWTVAIYPPEAPAGGGGSGRRRTVIPTSWVRSGG